MFEYFVFSIPPGMIFGKRQSSYFIQLTLTALIYYLFEMVSGHFPDGYVPDQTFCGYFRKYSKEKEENISEM